MKISKRSIRRSPGRPRRYSRRPTVFSDGPEFVSGSLPQVVIVGRPNVGKSTFFNALNRRRLAIVDKVPGTTRDRLSSFIAHQDVIFELIDTGGMLDELEGIISVAVDKQIKTAIQRADLILFLVDIRDGVLPADKEIARFLRKQNKPVILIANKADTAKFETDVHEFLTLGLKEAMPLSALQKRGLEILLDKIVVVTRPIKTRAKAGSVKKIKPVKLAIVGKRNVGKSTLVNVMAQEERVIVSELPGTTRDAVDVKFVYEDTSFIAIDTAGLRKKTKLKEAVEVYGHFRTESSIRRAEVVLFLVDAREEMSRVDKKIARFIVESGKPCIIVVNKWDLVPENVTTASYQDYLNKTLPDLNFAPITFISAKNTFNVWPTISLSVNMVQQSLTKVSTPVLNKILQKIKSKLAPPERQGRTPRVYYATQKDVCPPRIIIFVNDPALFTPAYQRFLMKSLRAELPFSEVPFRIELRKKPGLKSKI